MLNVKTLEGGMSALDDQTITDFKAHLRGDLLLRGDRGYDEARHVFNAMIDRHPALIVLCTGTADVIVAVNFAREHELLTAVRGGGHSVAGTGVCDGGLMINLSRMNSVRIDPVKRIAWVSGGARLADLDRETAEHGLVCPAGIVSATGVAGLTIGGGRGWLRAKLGMTIDNLLAVEMVTADGRFMHANNQENSDLFWAIRGGGGNFGIVTTFEFQLHPIEPKVMLCNPFYSAEYASPVLKAWRDFMLTAPDELTTEFFFWTIPEDERFPQALYGKDVVIPRCVYYGPAEDGEVVVRPLRHLAPTLVDLSGPERFVDIQQMLDPYLPYGDRFCYWKAMSLDRLTDEMCDTLVEHFLDRPKAAHLCPMALHYLNGVSQRVAEAETAYPSRNCSYEFEYNTTWSSPADNATCSAWVRSAWEELRDKYSQRSGGYLNTDSYSDDGLAWVKETFGANYPRLQQVKKRYDPMNLFRLNPNIPPAK